MSGRLLALGIALAEAAVSALYFERTLGGGARRTRFYCGVGAVLAAFCVLYACRPEWYFLSSVAAPAASFGFALLEAVAVVAALKRLSGRPLAEVVLFYSLRVLIMVIASLLPFAMFALFTGETVAYLVSTEWNDLLFSCITAVLDMGLLMAAAETVGRYIKKQSAELRWSQFVPVVASQVVSIGLVAALRGGADSYARMLAALLVLALLYSISDVVLFSAFRALVRNSELQKSVGELLQRQAYEKEYYLSVSEQLKTAQRMRHDYRNTLLTIDTLIQSGDTARARRFAAESQAMLSPGGVVAYTGNEILDAVLNNKAERARKENIEFALELTLSKPLPVTDTDLMSLFANLLDNAMEYVSALPEGTERRVAVADAICAGFWVIRFSNTFLGAEPPSFLTTKADKGLHGYGIGIVQSIASRYDGTMCAEAENGTLTIAVTLNIAGEIHAG